MDDKKILLFKTLFCGRIDVFPRYWENKAGKKGYNPACVNNFKNGCAHLEKLSCDNCENQKLLPLTDIEIKNHFAGFQLIGNYPLLQNGLCGYLAVDFDSHGENNTNNPLQDAKNFIDVCAIYNIPAYLERSKSGKGYHVWIFLIGLIYAWKVRLVIFALLREAKIIDTEEDDKKSFDRLFPNQDTLSGKSFGNLIALPFYGRALKQGNSTFLDKNFQPITTDANIIVFLESVERVSEATLDQIIDEWKLTREEERQTAEYIPPNDLGSREGLKRMIMSCSFFEHCNENQRVLSEPLWYDMASNLCRFDGGQEKFHDFSNRHPDYSVKAADQKINHAFRASGPVTCVKIRADGYNCPMLKGCGVESPAGLGAIPETSEPVIINSDIVEPFPIDAMPECVRDLIRQGAESMFCPPDFLGVALLVILGAAIGNKKSIQIKPGWIFKTNIYACIIALPGSAKSPAQTIVTKPIRELQNQMLKEYNIKKLQYDIDLSRWEFDCTQNKKEMKPPKPEPPVPDEIYTSDTTLEALVEMLANNDHGLTMIVDELTGWVNGLNQYKGGKGSDKEHYLSFWSGMIQKVNRKNKPPIVIESPFFSVIGNIPPSVLGSLVDEKSKGEEGFIHRILFAYPDPVSQQWSDCFIDQKVIDNYNDLFINLYEGRKVKWDNDASSTWDDPSTWGNESSQSTNQVLSLTPEAYSFWIECYNEIQKERDTPDFPENLHGPWSKMIAYFARIALIIHCIRLEDRETYSEKIDIESMQSAFKLIKYFCSHTKRVYSQLSESGEDKQFRQVLEWKNKHKKAEITIRELISARLCKNAEEAMLLFDDMQGCGLGEVKESQGKRGKKTLIFYFLS